MQLITLTPKTLKGKNRLNEAIFSVKKRQLNWDGFWQIGQTKETVSFNQNAGPWLFIFPNGSDFKGVDSCSRWVHKTQDIDFDVTYKD